MVKEERKRYKIKDGKDHRWLAIFSSVLLSEQLQKKLHQLEEQLDHEMQAKDELEHKCKYDWTRTEKQVWAALLVLLALKLQIYNCLLHKLKSSVNFFLNKVIKVSKCSNLYGENLLNKNITVQMWGL